MVELRPARLADAEAVAHLHAQGWWAYRGLLPEEFLARDRYPAALARWRSQLSRPSAVVGQVQVWVAELDGRVVGFTSFGPSADPRTQSSDEVVDLWVDQACRGTGIGSALFTHALASTRRPVVLWVLQGNGAARRLYERHGFVAAGLARSEELALPGGSFTMTDELMALLNPGP